jgi:hypothetical protein
MNDVNENDLLNELLDFCDNMEKEAEINNQAAKAFFRRGERK